MVLCDRFEIDVIGGGEECAVIEFFVHTDLPAGTLIIYSADRTYLDAQRQKSLWVGAGDKLTVSESGECRGSIDVAASDKRAADRFRQINSSDTPSGISTPVGDTIELSFVVGARQRLKAFGRNNSELSGSCVVNRGGINIVEARKELRIPMIPDLQPRVARPN